MESDGRVTLQVGLSPVDLPYARTTVPHQLRAWAGQVAEVVFRLDLHRSGGKKGSGWHAHRPGMEELLGRLCEEYSAARIERVDYTEDVAANVRRRIGAARLGPKDYRGTPVYAMAFGVVTARTQYVLHTDSDMLYGGSSQTWIEEAVSVLEEQEDVFAVSPLPGPPTPDGVLPPHVAAHHARIAGAARAPQLHPDAPGGVAYRFPHLSSRLFLIDRTRMLDGRLDLQFRRLSLRGRLLALRDRNPPQELFETVVSRAMAARGLVRVDMLGTPPGKWSLHPDQRTERFFRALPALVDLVERGDVPAEQRGDFELLDATIDRALEQAQ